MLCIGIDLAAVTRTLAVHRMVKRAMFLGSFCEGIKSPFCVIILAMFESKNKNN